VGLAVISVHVLNTVPRRPLKLNVEGLRRKERAEGGRCRAGDNTKGVFVCVVVVYVYVV
jgi:hypothetical protein